MNMFTRKRFDRIYVEHGSDIPAVKSVIQTLDPYEFSYMPQDLIAAFDQYPKVVYW